MNIIEAVKEYQCPGCVCGVDAECYRKGDSEACDKHVAGTMISGIGTIFLGMPKGFNRIGHVKNMKIDIFKNVPGGWSYDHLNVPVWKHLDSHGNTFVRGICPRLNNPFIHIFLGNHIDEIDCIDITSKLDEMD